MEDLYYIYKKEIEKTQKIAHLNQKLKEFKIKSRIKCWLCQKELKSAIRMKTSVTRFSIKKLSSFFNTGQYL